MSDKKPNQQYSSCVVCNGKHAIWSCLVESSKRKLQLREQSLLPSRSCVFPVCNQAIRFENAQNLESATSLIATALTMRSFTEPKEYTPQKAQQSHQLKEKFLRIPLVSKWKNLKILAPFPFFVLKVFFKSLNWNCPATHPALKLLFFWYCLHSLIDFRSTCWKT